jgi:mevalonate kinase
MPTVQIKRGTLAQLTAAASANQLLEGETYLITDEQRLAVATASNAFTRHAKLSEAGGGGSVPPAVLASARELAYGNFGGL